MPKKTYPPIYIDPNDGNDNYNPKKPNAEKLVYDALQSLSDEYYIFHSFHWQGSYKGRYKNGENDFMVYHPKKGLLIIEVKGGKIEFRDTQWQRVHHNNKIDILYGAKSPVDQLLQARGTMLQKLKTKLRTTNIGVSIQIAVWFPNTQFQNKEDNNLPLKQSQILDQSNLIDIESAINNIFEGSKPSYLSTDIFLDALLPTLNIVSDFKIEQETVEQKMITLTRGQSTVLDFTEEQHYTAIRGGAGTGKTVIAEEKVRRLQEQYPDDKILFLCFNRALKDVLEIKFKNDKNVNAINYDSLAVQMGDHDFVKENYGKFDVLREHFHHTISNMEKFPYLHIVIDEAQDLEESWIELLASTNPKHFYLFYDRNQDIFQDRKDVPNWMIDIDCRLSLHTNCRNTKEIAHFANCHISPLQHSQTEVVLRGVEGNKKPHIIFYKNVNTVKQFIGQQVAEWQANDIDVSENCRIVSLHSSRDKGDYKSISTNLGIKKGKYLLKTIKGNVNIPAISASKIKGLESDYIFITDVDLERYTDESFLKRMYIASSRAKHELYVFVKITDDVEVLKSALGVIRSSNFLDVEDAFQLLNIYADMLGATFE